MGSSYDPKPWSFPVGETSLEGILYEPGRWNGSAVVLLHGFMGNRYLLSRYAHDLVDEGYLCVAYDARGHGETGGRLSIEDMVSDVGAVVESLYFDHGAKAVGLLGQSMGGYVSALAAAEHDGIDAVVMISGAVNPLHDFFRSRLPPEPLLKMGKLLLDEFEKRDVDVRYPAEFGALLMAIRSFMSREDDPSLKVPRLTEISVRNLYNEFRDAPDAKGYAPAVSQPFISFHGTKDELVPYVAAEELFESVGSEEKDLVEFDGVGHKLYLSHADEISSAVLGFFERWL